MAAANGDDGAAAARRFGSDALAGDGKAPEYSGVLLDGQIRETRIAGSRRRVRRMKEGRCAGYCQPTG
jgi:hypothetical protein